MRQSSKRTIGERWTPELAKGGWTPIVDAFLENYSQLNPPITSMQAMLVIHLVKHKWDVNYPYPSLKAIAKRMGMTDTAVRSHVRKLEKNGYLKRFFKTGETNRFDLQPLFTALEKYVKEHPKARRADNTDLISDDPQII